jgi:hypothetical protein
MTRKWHGLPPPPFYFFGNVYKHLISKDHGIVVLASFNKEVIAGGVFFHFGERALYKYGASDRNYQHLRANNLVMWEAIKWYLERDYVTFSFGRTSPQNKGLLQFKDGWDTKRRTIKYYKYNLLRKTFESQNPVEDQFSSRFFQKLPVPVLKIMGSLLYKHMA